MSSAASKAAIAEQLMKQVANDPIKLAQAKQLLTPELLKGV